MEHPVKIANTLWDRAAELVEPPQFCFVVASDPPGIGTGTLAFRHNCNSLPDLIGALRELANKLEAGEARAPLMLVPTDPK